MLGIVLVAVICVTGCYAADYSEWSSWSSCSTTCGAGVIRRFRSCTGKDCSEDTEQTNKCFLIFCPSYLSWPRIHFSGAIVVDVNTVNNIRCAYENDYFSASQLSKHYIALEKMIEQKDTHVYYKKKTGNWNPGGSNQAYFDNTFVTSICVSPGVCLTNDSIVGLEVTEAARGVMAVLDVDWQYAIEIWAWRIRIPGVLEGDYESSSQHVETKRVDNVTLTNVGYAHPVMTRYKSKLTNITWNDQYYEKMFNNATDLSFNFVIDLFNQFSIEGRISGTIGLTSVDEPKETMATRTVRPSPGNKRDNAPFFIHYDKKVMTIDFGMSVGGRDDGRILASDTGKLDLAILLTRKTYCSNYGKEHQSICSSGNQTDIVSKSLTTGGELSKRIGEDAVWYLTYGGVMDIDLKHLDEITWDLTKKSRVAVMEQKPNDTEKIYMSEFAKGVVIGLKGSPTVRLNPGEKQTWHNFVSSYGKPAAGVEFEVYVVDRSNANTECGRSSCNITTGVPRDALRIVSPKPTTNEDGLVTFVLTAAEDPGNVRGCGLDGQIYPLRMFARYKIGKKTLTFSESGLYTKGGEQADYPAMTMSICARIYNDVPVKTCPNWNDVKGIFIQYYNLYPVMWNVGIIDLHSYTDIRKKAKILELGMFEYSFNDPKYMPISRDLSAGKSRLIKNWLKCGMRQFDPPPKEVNTDITCTKEFVEKEIKDLRILLSNAVLFELSTVPPYVTSWLSLKTEYGQNKEIADIIKSVFNEEMLHMTLAGNVLNAIGGKVVLTDKSKLPIYPTIMTSGITYQLAPNVQVSIEPFSLGLVENIFAGVETPANYETRQIFYVLAQIWEELLRNEESGEPVSRKMLMLVEEYRLQKPPNNKFNEETNEKSDLHVWEMLKELAEEALGIIYKRLGTTVGDLYARIALRLTRVESCVRIADLQGSPINNFSTVFTGNPSFQLNVSHWYQENSKGLPDVDKILNVDNNEETPNNKKANLTRPPLFEVVGLRSALEAMVEIVYQGEGGSECSPFVTDPDIYGSYRGRDDGYELSHYYRFQEIAHGKRLKKIKNPPVWADVKCLNASHCPSLLESDESYCYIGEDIPFHEEGVWPILSNPKVGEYVKGSKAFTLHHQFNLLYTRLLFCLQDTYGGNPDNIKTCMTIMYDLTIAGKHLVQTPLRVADNTTTVGLGNTGKNGAPTWIFVRDKPFEAGLPLRIPRNL